MESAGTGTTLYHAVKVAFHSPQYKILILLLNLVLKLNDLSVSFMQLLTVSYNESVISRLQLMTLYASPRVRFIALSQQYYYIMCDVKQCRASLWWEQILNGSLVNIISQSTMRWCYSRARWTLKMHEVILFLFLQLLFIFKMTDTYWHRLEMNDTKPLFLGHRYRSNLLLSTFHYFLCK